MFFCPHAGKMVFAKQGGVAEMQQRHVGADDPGSPQKRKKYCHSEPQAKNLRTKKLVRSEILRHAPLRFAAVTEVDRALPARTIAPQDDKRE